MAAMLSPQAIAGRAQAGGNVGLYSNYDLLSGSTTGQALADGVVVKTVRATGDPSSAGFGNFSANSSAKVQLDSRGVLAGPNGTALPFGGHRSAEADRTTGVLHLGGSSTYASYDVNGYRREGYLASGSIGAEIFESFEVRYDRSRVEPIVVNLRFTIDGTMSSNHGDNGYVNGAQLYAILGNTSQGVDLHAGSLQASVWRAESERSGQTIDVTGTLLNRQCLATVDWCESWVLLYVGMDFRNRVIADNTISGGGPNGAPFDANYTAHMALTFSPGVTVLQYDNRDGYEPLHAWVNPSTPVPEPAGWMLMLKGVACIGTLGWRRKASSLA